MLSRYLIQYEIPARNLGPVRACAARKTEEELQSETGDEDRPEMEPEPQTNTELEGLFVSLFYVDALPFLMCLQSSHFALPYLHD